VLLDVLESFRIHLAGHPLLLTLGVTALLSAAARSRLPRAPASGQLSLDARPIAWVSGCGLAAFVAIAMWYASDPHFFDNAEPTMVAVGWLFHLGQPVYHSLDSAERYAHIYGPLAFIFHGFALGALGPSIAVSKGLGVAASFLGLELTYLAARQHASRRVSLTLTGLAALFLLDFRQYAFWTRPEPFQMTAVAAALLAASRGGVASAVLTGMASGILWDLKFTGPFYSLAIFALLQRRTGWIGAAAGAVVALIVASLPFLVFGNVSLANYVGWIRASAGTGLSFSSLAVNLEWALYFVLILAGVSREAQSAAPEWRTALAALLVGMAGVVVAAAKPGAGPYHLLPFVPVVVYLIAWRTTGESRNADLAPVAARGAFAFVLVASTIALAQQAYLVTTMHERRQWRDVQDIERFAGTHPGVVEMGYGSSEPLSHPRPLLVFRSGSHLLDQPAIREHQLAGIDLPRATIDAVARCRVNYWLIPRGEAPFSATNTYPAMNGKALFPDAFREAFFRTHRQIEGTPYFDVWQCQSAKVP
jgi:hypothetical protein